MSALTLPCDWLNDVVEKITNIDHCVQPQFRVCVGAVHDMVGPLFDRLVASFCRILVRLALPVGDAKILQEVLHFIAQLTFCVVRQKLGWYIVMINLVLQCFEEQLFQFHAKYGGDH